MRKLIASAVILFTLASFAEDAQIEIFPGGIFAMYEEPGLSAETLKAATENLYLPITIQALGKILNCPAVKKKYPQVYAAARSITEPVVFIYLNDAAKSKKYVNDAHCAQTEYHDGLWMILFRKEQIDNDPMCPEPLPFVVMHEWLHVLGIHHDKGRKGDIGHKAFNALVNECAH